MNVDTGEFRALSDRVASLESDRVLLVRTIGLLVPPPPPEEPFELYVIEGGRA